MFTVRANLFETNSSSTHGICLQFTNIKFDYTNIKFDKDKILTIKGINFSGHEDSLCTTMDKISLCTMVIMSKFGQDKLIEFENWLKEKTGAKAIVNDIQFMKNAFLTTDLFTNVYIKGLTGLYKFDIIDKKKFSSTDYNYMNKHKAEYPVYCEFSILDIIKDKKFLEAFIFTPMSISFGEIEG